MEPEPQKQTATLQLKLATREDAERFIRDHLSSAEWKGEQLMITFAKEDLIHALVEQWTFPMEAARSVAKVRER